MRREQTLAVCGFAWLVVFEYPVLLAQNKDAKPELKTSELSIQTCDYLKKPAPGESLTDAANRQKAWWECLENGEGAGARLSEGMSTPVIMGNGRVVAGVGPRFVDRQSPPVTRTDINVRNSSSVKEPFTFTLGSGPWRKVISVNQVLRDGHRFLSTLGLTHKTPQPSMQ
jgi:hypothetical protein